MQGGLDLIPGQGTKSHTLQLRAHILQLKISSAAAKTRCSPISNFKKKKKKTHSLASCSLAGTRDTCGWSPRSSLELSGVDGFKILLTSPERVAITLFKDRGRLIADYTFPVTWKKIYFMRTQGHIISNISNGS